jgi:hypothetical protein
MWAVVSVRLQRLHQASAGGAVLPESEAVRSRLCVLALLPPQWVLVLVQLQVLVSILKLYMPLLKLWLLKWLPLQLLQGRFRTPGLTTTLGLLLHLLWLLALLLDACICVVTVGRGLILLVS